MTKHLLHARFFSNLIMDAVIKDRITAGVYRKPCRIGV